MRIPSGHRHHIPWYERHAGLSIALPVVLLSMATLASIRLAPQPTPPEPLPMRVTVEQVPEQELILEEEIFEEPEPEPEPEPEVAEDLPMVNPEAPEVIATRPNATETGDLIRDVFPDEAMEDSADEYEDPSQATFTNWSPDNQDRADIQAIERELVRELAKLEQRHTDLQKSLIRNEVESAARDFELASDGGTAGAIRLLDTSGFPDHIVRPILERHGMTFERRYTRPVHGRNFLNAARTDKGTFSNVAEEGYYDVLALSPKALAVMSARETMALRDKGYDPRTTRVLEITFGIIKPECQGCPDYDFGVVHLEVEQIR
ncbi:MAG: hypothetical protein JJU11_11950 [Candidatus Sumerlaeia bacterium]|nr:hypothetical protein [Candidatus Sumerlaeia bacterium]